MTQADTIIPPGVQGLDRYAYVNNSPMNFVDPTGHQACSDAYDFCGQMEFDGNVTVSILRRVLRHYNVKLNGNWALKYAEAAYFGVSLVSENLATARSKGESSTEAFKHVYGYMNFTFGGEGATGMCSDVSSGGCTSNRHQINFWSMSGDSDGTTGYRGVKNVVHELGHAFDWTQYNSEDNTRLSNHMPDGWSRDELFRPNMNSGEVVPDYWDWQQSPSNETSEILADMFVAWNYDTWSANPLNVDSVNAANTWLNLNVRGAGFPAP